MRIVTFMLDGAARPGAVRDDGSIVDLAPAAASVRDFIAAGEVAIARAHDMLATAEPVADIATAELLAPLPRPTQIRDCLTFETHLKNAYASLEKRTGRKIDIPAIWYEQPIYYKANRMNVIGPGATIEWPRYAKVLDYELELACVIGRQGTDIAVDRAGDHIFGYTIFNDVSARDAQGKEMAGQLGPAKGKDFDTGNVFGPWIVTADAIGDAHNLDMTVRVNGERRGGGNSRDMHHGFDDIIAFISQSETLYPGEILGSGTVGTGCGLEIGRYLEDGDEIELEIENIGILRNVIRKAA
jgi:2-keto-4-pentenoate hydratase/2-oxohepta-3-ene-1,7-dioic acid hydratase in catechol pathway